MKAVDSLRRREKRLKRYGIEVKASKPIGDSHTHLTMDMVISGNTYPVRALLKKVGFAWHGSSKSWRLGAEEYWSIQTKFENALAKLLKKLEGERPGEDPTAPQPGPNMKTRLKHHKAWMAEPFEDEADDRAWRERMDPIKRNAKKYGNRRTVRAESFLDFVADGHLEERKGMGGPDLRDILKGMLFPAGDRLASAAEDMKDWSNKTLYKGRLSHQMVQWEREASHHVARIRRALEDFMHSDADSLFAKLQDLMERGTLSDRDKKKLYGFIYKGGSSTMGNLSEILRTLKENAPEIRKLDPKLHKSMMSGPLKDVDANVKKVRQALNMLWKVLDSMKAEGVEGDPMDVIIEAVDGGWQFTLDEAFGTVSPGYKKAQQLARLMKKAGTSYADGKERIQKAHKLSDREMKSIAWSIWKLKEDDDDVSDLDAGDVTEGMDVDITEFLSEGGYFSGKPKAKGGGAGGVKVTQKPGEDYWYVKRGGKEIGVVSAGKGGKFDADTDSSGGGKFKGGFASKDDAVKWLTGGGKTEDTGLDEGKVLGRGRFGGGKKEKFQAPEPPTKAERKAAMAGFDKKVAGLISKHGSIKKAEAAVEKEMGKHKRKKDGYFTDAYYHLQDLVTRLSRMCHEEGDPTEINRVFMEQRDVSKDELFGMILNTESLSHTMRERSLTEAAEASSPVHQVAKAIGVKLGKGDGRGNYRADLKGIKGKNPKNRGRSDWYIEFYVQPKTLAFTVFDAGLISGKGHVKTGSEQQLVAKIKKVLADVQKQQESVEGGDGEPLTEGPRWDGKTVGKTWRLQWSKYHFVLEELPTKGKKKLRKMEMQNPGFSNRHNAFIAFNLLQKAKIAPGDSYDKAKSKLTSVMEAAVKEAGLDKKTWFHPREELVFYLHVEPEDVEPMDVDAKDFVIHTEWKVFGAYSPSSDLQNHDPSYTKVVSKSPGAARKLYKLLKANPAALKGVPWSKFTDWLKKKKIGYEYQHSVWH
jgi:hypothetical protein